MDLSLYPLPFFISALTLMGASLFAWRHRRDGWGLPMLAVLGTIAVWYHGDGLYNDYEEYQTVIGDDALNAAWWQVLLFIVTLWCLTPGMHRFVNKRLLKRRSHLVLYASSDQIKNPRVQHQIDILCRALLIVWLVLMAIAVYRKGWDFGGMFMPYLEGYRVKPWARDRIGGGFSALLSLAGYLQIMLTASFGVLAALSHNPKTRMIAIVVCFLAFPYYIFDRTRNPMIATMLPGVLAWVFIRLRVRMWKKGVILLALFMMLSSWMKLVVTTEMGRGNTIVDALKLSKEYKKKTKEAEAMIDVIDADTRGSRHQGLSMFSELAYISNFIEHDTYQVSWGGRYFAEIVNVIPRALWKNKPLVGIDYAIARGFADEGGGKSSGGVTASIATGMIGQGVVNFGGILGPMCAALIMSVWVSILARLDLRGNNPGRLLLCGLGMILTFNMGRDITLFVLYPFVFGYIFLLAWEWQQKKKIEHNISAVRRRQSVQR
jgi:hypothetical protein